MVAIGKHLVGAGHRVRMLTGSRFADLVEAAGMEHISLPAEADYDDRNLAEEFKDGAHLTGIRRLQFDVTQNFVAVMPHQYRGIREQLLREPADAVLGETAFTGVIPLLLERDRARPPVLICGVLPLTMSSRDTAPFGMGLQPSSSGFGRLRNRALNRLVARGVFRRAQRIAQAHLVDLGTKPLPVFVLDGLSLADRMLQLTGAGFEYPRSDLPIPVEFVGPVLPSAVAAFEPPEWWSDLDGGRPVVHVTQGTIANGDLDRLIGPTLRALADRDLLVVATTGDEQSAAQLRKTAPANARVAAFLPYDQLLAKVDVMITNGGYGGVQFALANGVPLVVAGDTEDKPEIAARVAWAGVGVNLRTGSPSSDAVGDAVDRVLRESGFRAAAARMAEQFGQTTPLHSIARALQDAVSVSRPGATVSADGSAR
jgi:UDP:flavonoid glycosyltransferase YjiC (YdhE family)